MLKLDRACIEQAIGFFSEGVSPFPHALVTAFDRVGPEAGSRSHLLAEAFPGTQQASEMQALAHAFQRVSSRFLQPLTRMELLDWMRRELLESNGSQWSRFAALAIKDFHVDLAGLMDSIAPVILLGCNVPLTDLPGFADLQTSGSRRAKEFRSRLPASVLQAVDASDRWWSPVKRIRKLIIHGDLRTVVYGGPANGILFQAYEPQHVPKILDPAFVWMPGKNVVDFRRYSACVLAELIVFLDRLGIALAERMGKRPDDLALSMLWGDFTNLLASMRELLGVEARG